MIPSPLGLLQAFSLFAVAILLSWPLGSYMRKVMEGERVFLSPVLRPVERGVYKILRVDETVEQRWTAYATSDTLQPVPPAVQSAMVRAAARQRTH